MSHKYLSKNKMLYIKIYIAKTIPNEIKTFLHNIPPYSIMVFFLESRQMVLEFCCALSSLSNTKT